MDIPAYTIHTPLRATKFRKIHGSNNNNNNNYYYYYYYIIPFSKIIPSLSPRVCQRTAGLTYT